MCIEKVVRGREGGEGAVNERALQVENIPPARHL